MGRLLVGLAAGFASVACCTAAVMVGRRVRRWMKWRKVLQLLEELEEGCATPVGRLRQVVDAMAVEMHAGLASEGGSKLKMLLTHVDNLPNGTEKGTYYALHLGGTNFRILRVQLGGQRSTILVDHVQRQPIPEDLMNGTTKDLFEFIASSLEGFVEQEGSGSEHLQNKRELGFTFSFPLKQISVSSGILMKWTKGFTIEDMVQRNVSECLEQATSRKGLDIQVSALINDTVGTLALGHYEDEDTVAAVIIGTGTNACYVERTDAIIKCQGLSTSSGSMVVNIEWGNFWSSHLPRTPYDIELDLSSQNPSDQGFEKMISGMYLGDIVRRVFLRMSRESDVFGPISSKLETPFVLETSLMAAMHEDDSPELSEVGRILREILELPDVSLPARKIAVKVCDVVTRRAARLVAGGIVGILKKVGRDGTGGIYSGRLRSGSQPIRMRRTVVAIEGGLVTSYSLFREYLDEAMSDILGDEISSYVTLRVMEDGSCIGAALLAASLSRSNVR
ncbi:unnamed protein product [Cuscuta campestris]|uniref:Phosphotransferase n=2 Tax=Cuscuta sect. Cleistogrammica TaxID=1824901 RepID=A0A484NP34_9ASTE|nr:hypothetical protein DM860_009900 [Cuscuta australis]VFR02941.1 unnamed protein product [Cuscuta campestris]